MLPNARLILKSAEFLQLLAITREISTIQWSYFMKVSAISFTLIKIN